MSLWIEILIVVVIVVVVILYFSNKDEKKISEKTTQMLIEIDNRYQSFVYSEVDESKGSSQFDVESYTSKAMVLLKPLISGLVSYINASVYTGIEVDYVSVYFSNLVGATEEAFRDSENNKDKKLSKKQESDFYNQVESAIRADLAQRKMLMKD